MAPAKSYGGDGAEVQERSSCNHFAYATAMHVAVKRPAASLLQTASSHLFARPLIPTRPPGRKTFRGLWGVSRVVLGACSVRIACPLLFAVAVIAATSSPLTATAAQLDGGPIGSGQPGESIVVTQSPMASGATGGASGDCGCRGGQPQQSWQQPPWHGNVRGNPCGEPQPCCRGSNVYQAHPFQQLHWKHSGCATLPPCLPRLHAMCREGYLPSPVPPVQPRCHQCGARIEGGF